jgi:hypothetical protein
MNDYVGSYVSGLMADVRAKNPAEPEFHQAVQEVAESVVRVLDKHAGTGRRRSRAYHRAGARNHVPGTLGG